MTASPFLPLKMTLKVKFSTTAGMSNCSKLFNLKTFENLMLKVLEIQYQCIYSTDIYIKIIPDNIYRIRNFLGNTDLLTMEVLLFKK